jgi:hypothetical protein
MLREMAAVFAWWRINRPANPRLVATELRAARKLLAKFPEAGEVDQGRGGEVRRLVLRRFLANRERFFKHLFAQADDE